MRKIIILLLCCGVLVSMVGCGGNTAALPTKSPPTTISETIITEKTSSITAVEPTEKEKDFPTFKGGNRKFVEKEKFRQWIEAQSGGNR